MFHTWAESLTYEDPIFGTASNFEKEFKAAYPEYKDKKVPYQTAQAAAAVYVFKDAFERAGSLDKDKVRDALSATDLKTFYGNIKFSEAGNNIAKPMVFARSRMANTMCCTISLCLTQLNYPRGG